MNSYLTARSYHTPGVYFEHQDASPALISPIRTDIAGFVGVAQRGPLHTPVRVESLTQFTTVFGAKLPQSYLAYAVDGFFANGGRTCWVVRSAVEEDAKTASLDIVDDGGNRILTILAGSPGAWGDQIEARWILGASGNIFSLTLEYADGTNETYRNPLSQIKQSAPTSFNLQQNSLPSAVSLPLSQLLQPDPNRIPVNTVSVRALQGQLSGGADGLLNLTPARLSGNGAPIGKKWGLATLEDVRDVAVVAIPDIMPVLQIAPKYAPTPPPDCSLDGATNPPLAPPPPAEFPPTFTRDQILGLQQDVINHCEKLHNRVAILDSPDILTAPLAFPPDQMEAWRKLTNFNSAFAGLYYPWILVDDPLQLSGIIRSIPPSGHIAGIYARSDLQKGVHKPPANEVIQGAEDTLFPVDDVIHGELNDLQVNVLRAYPGRGLRVFGARTLSGDPMWRYINVRRLMCMIEVAIYSSTQWTVFEPNDTLLQRELDRVIRSFLESLFRRGMLDGATSSDAYTVQCDDSLNPPDEVDRGKILCMIGVQPPLPAEFVVVLIGKTQNGIEPIQPAGADQNA